VHDNLRAALEVIIPELFATTGLSPEVRDDEWAESPQEPAMLVSPDGTGRGIWVMSDEERSEQLAELEDQIQEWGS
jgi:hypothetical protein